MTQKKYLTPRSIAIDIDSRDALLQTSGDADDPRIKVFRGRSNYYEDDDTMM